MMINSSLDPRAAAAGVVLRGDIYRQTHQATVDAVLTTERRLVVSKGDQFFNRDRWTMRRLIAELCEWAEQNPGAPLGAQALRRCVADANRPSSVDPGIVIAQTPERLDAPTALALTGGAYHEAWHTLYSVRRDLTVEEVQAILAPRWHQLPNWAPVKGMLLQWSNLIEDIRIERLGNRAFPGAWSKMHHLQDLILQMESKLAAEDRDALFHISAAFRDRGLGYETEQQADAWARYLRDCPQAVHFVTQGPLWPILDEAIHLSEADDLGALRLALEVIIALHQVASEAALAESAARAAQSQTPHAPCTQALSGQGKGPDRAEQPQGEGPDHAEQPQDARDASEPASSESGRRTEWAEMAQGALQVAQQKGAAAILDSSSALSSALSEGALAQRDPQETAQEGALSGEAVGPGRTGLNVGGHDERIYLKSEQVAKTNLQVVRTQCAYLRANLVQKMRALKQVGVYHGLRTGHTLSEPYLVDTALSLRHGQIPRRAYAQTDTRVERSMAVAIVADQSGSMAHLTVVEGEKVSLSTIAVRLTLALADPLDHLGVPTLVFGFRSSGGPPPSGDRAPRVGPPREGSAHVIYPLAEQERGEIQENVCFDMLKSFEERLTPQLYRFSHLRANGSTPTASGIRFATMQLKDREEKHKFVFVITDGQPTSPEVLMKESFQKARAAGVHVIGVGMGPDAHYVKGSFEEHVWSEDMQSLAPSLVRKLNSLVDRRLS